MAKPITADPTAPGDLSGPHTRLTGTRLTLARTGWIGLITLTTVLILVSIPVRYSELTEILANLSPAQELTLRNLGVSSALQVNLIFANEYLVTCAFLAMGTLIFLRRSRDWVAIFISSGLVTLCVWTTPPFDALIRIGGAWEYLARLVESYAFVAITVMFLTFPDGLFVPRWSAKIVPVVIGIAAFWYAFPKSPINFDFTFQLTLVSYLIQVAVRTFGVWALAYRFFRVSTAVQKQQIKWIFFSASLAIILYLAFGFDRFVVPLYSEARTAAIVYDMVIVPVFLITMLPVPVAFVYAILRHRLWDIDALISRTLVYTTLTASLAGIYTASITLTQRVFVAVTGERSSAAIAITTLIVAASFTPIRTALQTYFDRYFKRPDPQRELRAFGGEVASLLATVDTQRLVEKSLIEMMRAFDAQGAMLEWDHRYGEMAPLICGEWMATAGLTVPIIFEGRRCGHISLGPRLKGRTYSAQDAILAEEAASFMAATVGSLQQIDFRTRTLQHNSTENATILIPGS